MSGTSGGSFVRLSDTEISKILSIPMSLVSESSQQDEQAKNVNVSSASLCDNSSNQRNLLHLSKVVVFASLLHKIGHTGFMFECLNVTGRRC